MITDQLNNLNADEVSAACIDLLNSLQNHQPSIQVAAVVSLERLLMDSFQLDIRQEITRLERLMTHHESKGWDKKFNAVRDYIKGELLNTLK